MDDDPAVRYRTAIREASTRIASCLKDAPAGSGQTPYLDALVLLAHAANLSKEQLFARFEDRVSPTLATEFEILVRRRCSGEPVSYIRGHKEFFGREFSVGPGVLVPRPDTELLVERLLEEADRVQPAHVHDCCTGSGCVAVTLALERTCTVTASDLSREALRYARQNADHHQARVDFWCGNLLEPLADRIDRGTVAPANIIAANPPYVNDNEVHDLTSRGWPEPALALAGGEDGLEFIRRLATGAAACLPEGGCFMVEHGAEQGPSVAEVLMSAGFSGVVTYKDLAGRDRVCRGIWSRQ